MKLVDKYLMEIGKYLPKSSREDILKELKSDIDEQRTSGASVEEIIDSMGDPREIARSYNPNLNYLIGPELRDTYFKVLWITLSAVTLGLLVAHIVSLIFNDQSVLSVIGGFFGVIWMAFIMTFGIVTLIFILVNRYLSDEIKIESHQKVWHVEDLKQVKPKSKDYDLAEIILTIVFNLVGIIFINFIMRDMNLIGVNLALIYSNAWILTLMWSAEIVLMSALLIKKGYTPMMRIFKILLTIATTFVVVRILINPELITPEGINILENISRSMVTIVGWLPKIIIVIAILGLLTEIGKQIRAIFK
jgi:hypothetical protein